MEVMVRRRLLSLAAAAALLAGGAAGVSAAVAPAASASGPCGTLTSAPAYTHVIWVMMENHGYNTIIGSPQAPYINGLASGCGLATNYHNISHPSLPNYIAATAGPAVRGIREFATACRPLPPRAAS